MPQWALDNIQLVLLGLFAVASISAEWRRPALILAGFALLYRLMAVPFFDDVSLNGLFREYDSPLFMLMWTGLDLLGAAVIFNFCRPSATNKSFSTNHWLAISGLLLVCSFASYLNFCYTTGYAVYLSTPIYNKIMFSLAVILPLIVYPGIKDGAREIKKLVTKQLGLSALPDHSIYPQVHERRRSFRNSGLGNAGRYSLPGFLVGHRPDRDKAEEE